MTPRALSAAGASRSLVPGVFIAGSFLLMSHARLPIAFTAMESSLLILAGALGLLVYLRWDAYAVRVPLTVVALLGLALASVIWSTQRSATVSGLVTYTALAIAAFIIATHVRPTVILAAIAIASIAILTVSYLFALVDPITGFTQGPYDTGTLRGVYYGRNDLSHTIAFGVPALLALPLRWRLSAVYKAVGIAYLLSGIVAADTSTAIVTLGAVIAVAALLFVLRPLSRRRRVIVAIAAASVATLGAIALALNWDAAFSLVGRNSTFTGRTGIWAASLDVAAERPVLGFGWDAVWGGPAGNAIKDAVEFPGDHPHNGFIEIFLELGLIGLLVFLAVFAIALYLGTRAALVRDSSITTLWVPLMIVFTVLYDLVETFSLDGQGWLMVMVAIGLSASGVSSTKPWLRSIPLLPRGLEESPR